MIDEKIIQEISTSQEFTQFLQEYIHKIIKKHIATRFAPNGEKRMLTMCEKELLLKSYEKKATPPLQELTKLGADINTFVMPINGKVYTLFTALEKSRSDEEMCEVIDELIANGYNLNERTIYNGSNTLLTCILAVKPKSAMKLLQLGVSPHATNQTLDTVYGAVRDFAQYRYPFFDSILEQRNLLYKKEELINEYQKILEYLEEKNISENVNDDFYQELDENIDKLAIKYVLTDEDKENLKRVLYEFTINTLNSIASNMFLSIL